MDIGIMPLPEGQEWMRFKAATKLVQYMAIGIPAVASPIGVNADILAGNRVGLAASDEDQWFESLRILLGDPALRTQMGNAGRTLVESRYCIEANLDALENVLVPQ
jgi:glycosyltransferase involved in cell wall biosynthesis